MLLRFLVLGGLLLTSQRMAIAQDPLPHTSLKAYRVLLGDISSLHDLGRNPGKVGHAPFHFSALPACRYQCLARSNKSRPLRKATTAVARVRFWHKSGTARMSALCSFMSAFGGKADMD